MKNSKYKKIIAKNILNKTASAGSFAFETLMFFGELTMDAFLSPNYYAELPSGKIRINKNTTKTSHSKNNHFKKRIIRQALERMEKQGSVRKKEKKYSLTSSGKELAGYIGGRKKVLDKKWDRKYRIVIFDIPEKKKNMRNWLREELYTLNYCQLQKSVFISKYSLTEDLIKEIAEKRISKYVNYLLVDKVYDLDKAKLK